MCLHVPPHRALRPHPDAAAASPRCQGPCRGRGSCEVAGPEAPITMWTQKKRQTGLLSPGSPQSLVGNTTTGKNAQAFEPFFLVGLGVSRV